MRSEHPELAGPAKRCLGALATVSWPWVPVLGSLEPSRRGGENAQKTGENGEEMGEIWSKRYEGVGITLCVTWPGPSGRSRRIVVTSYRMYGLPLSLSSTVAFHAFRTPGVSWAGKTVFGRP